MLASALGVLRFKGVPPPLLLCCFLTKMLCSLDWFQTHHPPFSLPSPGVTSMNHYVLLRFLRKCVGKWDWSVEWDIQLEMILG